MKNKLTLQDVEWRAFELKDYFDFYLSKGDNQATLLSDGVVPLISSGSSGNGICKFIEQGDEKSEIFDKNLITVDMFGKPFFHAYKFYSVSHGRINILKEKQAISNNTKKFIIKAIEKSTEGIFSYNRMCSQKRLSSIKINLPIDKNDNPNWQFMEDYIEQEQKEIASKVVKYYQNKLAEILESIDGGLQPIEYKDTMWKVFEFNEIFREIKRGKRLTKANQINGKTPYISSSAINNGVDNFISNDENIRKFDNCLSIANSGSVGSCFYHTYEYVASDHITSLKLDNENSDEYIYLFMASIIKKLEEKYSFNREINDSRIQREKLILPADEDGNPDFNYMRSFIINIQKENIEKTLNYIYIYI